MAWRTDEVAARKGEIEAAGLTWDVIESIPVSEPIKTRTGPWRAHIDAWIAKPARGGRGGWPARDLLQFHAGARLERGRT